MPVIGCQRFLGNADCFALPISELIVVSKNYCTLCSVEKLLKKLIILSFSVKMIDRQLPTMTKGDNIQESNSITHQTNAGGGRETRCRIQKLMQKW